MNNRRPQPLRTRARPAARPQQPATDPQYYDYYDNNDYQYDDYYYDEATTTTTTARPLRRRPAARPAIDGGRRRGGAVFEGQGGGRRRIRLPPGEHQAEGAQPFRRRRIKSTTTTPAPVDDQLDYYYYDDEPVVSTTTAAPVRARPGQVRRPHFRRPGEPSGDSHTDEAPVGGAGAPADVAADGAPADGAPARGSSQTAADTDEVHAHGALADGAAHDVTSDASQVLAGSPGSLTGHRQHSSVQRTRPRKPLRSPAADDAVLEEDLQANAAPQATFSNRRRPQSPQATIAPDINESSDFRSPGSGFGSRRAGQ